MNNEVFRRKETKYIITEEQYNSLLKEINDNIEKDKYFKSTICNIYYDTPNDDLIIKSIEKPIYKEKVRIRSYGLPKLDDNIFLEIKKKYKGIVGKRRIIIKLKDFYDYIETGKLSSGNEQIKKELEFCFDKYKLEPRIFLCYDRKSYIGKSDKTFRLTFDSNIRSRKDNLRLEYGLEGHPYFDDNSMIMEVKALNAYPLWFSKVLSKLKIYPHSFSKYGAIYEKDFEEE